MKSGTRGTSKWERTPLPMPPSPRVVFNSKNDGPTSHAARTMLHVNVGADCRYPYYTRLVPSAVEFARAATSHLTIDEDRPL